VAIVQRGAPERASRGGRHAAAADVRPGRPGVPVPQQGPEASRTVEASPARAFEDAAPTGQAPGASVERVADCIARHVAELVPELLAELVPHPIPEPARELLAVSLCDRLGRHVAIGLLAELRDGPLRPSRVAS